ncbi:MAG: hypothetical protein M5R36_08700 [Deltaproteobacteria bacterium]|nr:hypothetical protein [Deltaproteobacteria bacterium]
MHPDGVTDRTRCQAWDEVFDYPDIADNEDITNVEQESVDIEDFDTVIDALLQNVPPRSGGNLPLEMFVEKYERLINAR